MLTREQVEAIIAHYERTLEKLCGSDGVNASDLLKHDAALRAHLAESERAAYDVNGTIDALKAEVEGLKRRENNGEKQLCDLSVWCENLTMVQTNKVIGQNGWPYTLGECVQKAVNQYITDLTAQLAAMTQERDAMSSMEFIVDLQRQLAFAAERIEMLEAEAGYHDANTVISLLRQQLNASEGRVKQLEAINFDHETGFSAAEGEIARLNGRVQELEQDNRIKADLLDIKREEYSTLTTRLAQVEEALRVIATEPWTPFLSLEYETDSRDIWPKKQYRIITIAKQALTPPPREAK